MILNGICGIRAAILMFAIAFDLVVAEAAIHHPRGVTAAYMDIGFDVTASAIHMGQRVRGRVLRG
jgi:hypothetical protein